MALRFRAWIGLTAEGSRCPREPSPRSRPPDLKRRAPHQLRLGAPRSAVPFGAQPASRACVEERPRISRVWLSRDRDRCAPAVDLATARSG